MFARNYLIKYGATLQFADLVCQVIADHTYKEKQNLRTTESLVLYIADKLELLSLDRFIAVENAFKLGKITGDTIDSYGDGWHKRLLSFKAVLAQELPKRFDIQVYIKIRKLAVNKYQKLKSHISKMDKVGRMLYQKWFEGFDLK